MRGRSLEASGFSTADKEEAIPGVISLDIVGRYRDPGVEKIPVRDVTSRVRSKESKENREESRPDDAPAKVGG